MQTRDEFSVRRRILLALAALPLVRGAGAAEDVDAKRTGGPYVPTPQVVVDEMLRIGKVGPDDFVVDLGSGDGIIVLTAATRLKARGYGVDIDPELVKLANGEAKKRGVADRAAFYVQDVFKADISRATVVTLYLLPGMMVSLRPKILAELRPGTRVVSHDYRVLPCTCGSSPRASRAAGRCGSPRPATGPTISICARPTRASTAR
jgi:hypothetical protein